MRRPWWKRLLADLWDGVLVTAGTVGMLTAGALLLVWWTAGHEHSRLWMLPLAMASAAALFAPLRSPRMGKR